MHSSMMVAVEGGTPELVLSIRWELSGGREGKTEEGDAEAEAGADSWAWDRANEERGHSSIPLSQVPSRGEPMLPAPMPARPPRAMAMRLPFPLFRPPSSRG